MKNENASSGTRINFDVAENWLGRVAVVSVSGDLDVLTAPELAAAIQAAVQRRPEAMIVDLSCVQFLASAGMSVLITASRDLEPAVRFGVVADGPSTSRLLKLIGIDTLVAVYQTLDDAVRAKGAQHQSDTSDPKRSWM